MRNESSMVLFQMPDSYLLSYDDTILVRLAWLSRSMKSTFFPIMDQRMPTLNADMVFATPPLLFKKQITFPIIPFSIASAKIIIIFVKNSIVAKNLNNFSQLITKIIHATSLRTNIWS